MGDGVQRAATEVVLFLKLGENEVFSGTSGLLHCVYNDENLQSAKNQSILVISPF
jgi:hypothetical protein